MESYCTPYDPFYTSTSLHLKEVNPHLCSLLTKENPTRPGQETHLQKRVSLPAVIPQFLDTPNQNRGLFLVASRKDLGTRIQGQTCWKSTAHPVLYIYHAFLIVQETSAPKSGVGVMMPGPGPPGHASHIGPNLVTLLQLPLVSFVTLLRLHHCWVVGMYINVFHVGCIVFPIAKSVPSPLSIFSTSKVKR